MYVHATPITLGVLPSSVLVAGSLQRWKPSLFVHPEPPIFFEHNYNPSHVPMNRLAGFLSVSRVWRMQSRFFFFFLSFLFFLIKAPSGCPLLAERRKTNKIETLPSNRLATGPFLNYKPTIRGAITTPPEKSPKNSTPYDAWLHGLGKHHITGTNTSLSLDNGLNTTKKSPTKIKPHHLGQGCRSSS